MFQRLLDGQPLCHVFIDEATDEALGLGGEFLEAGTVFNEVTFSNVFVQHIHPTFTNKILGAVNNDAAVQKMTLTR